MKVKEKFEKLISEIEDLANRHEYLKPKNIGYKVASSSGIVFRDLNSIFTYLTGVSLNDYIKERQIMAAYTTIVSMPIFDIEVAISVSGYDNQSSLGKKFKERFGITPTEAFREKDFSRISEQITWDMISNGVNLFDNKIKASKPDQKERFGIPAKEYLLITEAANLQVLYEFDDTQSNIAYIIAKDYKVSLRQAFDFVDDYCVYLDYISGQSNANEEEMTEVFNASKEIAFIFFNVINEIGTAVNLVGEIKALGHNPLEFDKDFLNSRNAIEVCKTKKSFCAHNYAGSWNKKKSRKTIKDLLPKSIIKMIYIIGQKTWARNKYAWL